MKTVQLSKRILLASIFGIAAIGCNNSDGHQSATGGNTSTPRSSGGVTAEGGSSRSGGATGSGSTGPGGAGGTIVSGGGGGQASSGGSMGAGGTIAVGGSSGGGGQAGDWAVSGGRNGTGGQAGLATGSGGRAGDGGQAGRATGGIERTGGVPAGGGVTGSGGQAGRATGGSTGAAGQTGSQRSIAFGTLLDAQAVMSAAQQLAISVATPSAAGWQAKGDQHRKYRFADANADEPYRLYVPTNWDGKSSLPLAMFLNGNGSDENSYVDANNKQMVSLAQEHGYILVSPLGDKGQYGNFLRLQSPFGKPEEAAKLIAEITAESERSAELSERDVINVLELVLAEYPIDRASMFLFGHSMGSGGTWYIGGKYATYWRGLAPMSGPFVQETGYPWDSLRETFIFVTEGTQAPSLEGSRVLRDWLTKKGFKSEYKEVSADHGGMVKLVLPDVFDFFDRSRAK